MDSQEDERVEVALWVHGEMEIRPKVQNEMRLGDSITDREIEKGSGR